MKKRIITAVLLVLGITMVLSGCKKATSTDNVVDSTKVQVISDSTIVK